MWLSVKSSLPVQCQPLHEEGRLCRRERVGLRGESPPLKAGIPALALEATELCALGTPSTPPTHTHTASHPSPNPRAKSHRPPATSAGQSGGTGTKEGGLLAQQQGDVEWGAVCPKGQPPILPACPTGQLGDCKDTEQERCVPLSGKGGESLGSP